MLSRPVMKTAIGQRGAALILAVMILSFLAVLGGALLTSATIDIWIGDNFKTRMQTLYLAESGIEQGREYLRSSGVPFIGQIFVSGGDSTGTYQVWLQSAAPLMLDSVAVAGTSQRTIEVAVIKSGFPDNPADPRLNSVAGLERIVSGISNNATDIYPDGSVIGNYGSPSDYRVAVVNGNCTFGPGTGYGLLLVRGNLTFSGAYSWTGVILVIGQGGYQSDASAIGQVTGGFFAAGTRDISGNLLPAPSGITFVENDSTAFAQANASFPYTPISIREW